MNQDALIPAIGTFKKIVSSEGIENGELAYSSDTKQLFIYDGLEFVPVTAYKNSKFVGKDSTLKKHEDIIILVESSTQTLPPAVASGKTYLIINDSDKSTIIAPFEGDKIRNIKELVIKSGEVFTLVDYKLGFWICLK